MMKNFISQILLLFCCLGVCGQGVTEINIPAWLKTERDPLLSEIASDIQLIKLETKPECLIQSVTSVTRWGDHLLVVANGRKSLLIFAKDGKFLKSFGAIGKGPGEFLEIYAMALDPKTNHLFILDNGQVKLLEFDANARFIREFKPGFYATGVKVLENGFVFYTGSVYNYKTDGYLLTVTDRNSKILNRYHQRNYLKGLPDRVGPKYTDGGSWCYWEPYWDTVYSFNGSSVQPKYFFNLGRNRIPQEFLESNADMFDNNLDSYTWITNYTEFQKFLYIGVIDRNRQGKKLIYDKVKKTGYCIKWDKGNNDWGFVNDFCSGPLFTITIKMSMTEAACAYQMVDLKEYLVKGRIDLKNAKTPARFKELTEIINRSSVDDNPILIIAALR